MSKTVYTWPFIRQAVQDACATTCEAAATKHNVPLPTVKAWRLKHAGIVQGPLRRRIVAHLTQHGASTPAAIANALALKQPYIANTLWRYAHHGTMQRITEGRVTKYDLPRAA